eukprot:2517948-Prymnesium_polylepis.2
MFTGWPSATGFAAPDRMHTLGEQLARPEIGRPLEDDCASGRELGGLAAASLAERVATGRSEALGRPCLDVGWKRGTLEAVYRRREAAWRPTSVSRCAESATARHGTSTRKK